MRELCGLDNTPKAQGQTSQSKMATIRRLVWRSTSLVFKREFLAIGKKAPFGKVRDHRLRFEYQERGRVHLHGVVWCERDNIPSDVICATMPRESEGFDPKFIAYRRELYKECNMLHQCYPDKCCNIGHGHVCTKCKSGYPFSGP